MFSVKLGKIINCRCLHTYGKLGVMKVYPSPNFKVNEIHVNFAADDESAIYLSFMLNGENHRMNRPKLELMDKTLTRLVKNYNKKLHSSVNKRGKNNKKAVESHDKPTVIVTLKNQTIDTSILYNMDFKTDMCISFNEVTLSVVFNPPEVVALNAFPRELLIENCPIVPQITTLFADGYECVWCQESSPRSGDYVVASSETVFIPDATAIGCKVKLFCTPYVITNSDNNTDSTVIDKDHSRRTGRATSFYLSAVVTAQSAVMNRMLDIRREFINMSRIKSSTSDSELSNTSTSFVRTQDGLRVVTYNILAEPFATSDYAVNVMFKYCDPQHLETEYRIQRVLREIRAYDADIVCLQECDSKCFTLYLQPLLSLDGYVGHYTNKVSGVLEGCATFIRTASCTVLRHIDVPLKNVLRNASFLEGFYVLRPDLRDVLGAKLGTVAQITVCQSVFQPDKVVVVANTHLFYHPLANYLRVLQMDVIVQCVSSLLHGLRTEGLSYHMKVRGDCLEATENGGNALSGIVALLDGVSIDDLTQIPGNEANNCRNPVLINDIVTAVTTTEESLEVCNNSTVKPCAILLGDLNSCPTTGLIQYLNSGSIEDEKLLSEYSELQLFRWGKSETVDEPIATTMHDKHKTHNAVAVDLNSTPLPDLRHNLKLISAAGYPQYSNYTAEFRNLLDYIFIETDSFEVIRVADFPTEDVLAEKSGLPSEVFPSDHIAVAVDLRFRH